MKELAAGIKVEKEHKKTYNFIDRYLKINKKMPPKDLVFKHIAKDHLREDRNYYSKLRMLKL